MVRVNFLIALALATGSLAASNCQAKDNACRTAPSANMAQCAADKAACCSTAYDDCRGAPNANMATFQYNSCRVGPDANMSSCVAEHASCCSDAFDLCRGAPGANMAQCASENAACKNQK
ncbi:hypothetical protein N7519_004012 [Penicillium mononematosum]|uniref:uncharacterized protein n=1 Tax=Penicillium mononematosum TaxID=268346 RepID=UPI002547EC6C|nr:uncharacterized protein N7519_004012 [Penicillium mononematosum]KAJ6189104.1 hypothetical protein N7519_004012 [Penicillium mononematosum]